MKRKLLGSAVALACVVCLGSTAQAALTIVSTVGGQPASGVNYVTFNDLALGGAGGNAMNTANDDYITVAFNPDAKVVENFMANLYAAPVLSGGNGANFDSQPNGTDATHYLTTGSTGAYANSSITLTFTSDQQYLGLLWGSVDLYNTLEFFDGATSLGTITGVDVNAFANGDQGASGTFYVNINSDAPFDRVVATSSQYAFELDNVAYSSNPIPEPASLIVWTLLGMSFAGAGWWRRRRRTA